MKIKISPVKRPEETRVRGDEPRLQAIQPIRRDNK